MLATHQTPSALAALINPAAAPSRSEVSRLIAEGFDVASLASFRTARRTAAARAPQSTTTQEG